MLDHIFPIVEGDGEVKAVPILLRRFAQEVFNQPTEILPAYHVPRTRMRSDTLDKAVKIGANKLAARGGSGAIMVILDGDDDRPCQLGPHLLERVRQADTRFPSSVVVAVCEYEAWFLAAAVSLRGKRSIKPDAVAPDAPEAIRDAKGHLQRNLMIPGSYYAPTVDQPALTAQFSFEEARRCPSFDKLWRDLERLFST